MKKTKKLEIELNKKHLSNLKIDLPKKIDIKKPEIKINKLDKQEELIEELEQEREEEFNQQQDTGIENIIQRRTENISPMLETAASENLETQLENTPTTNPNPAQDVISYEIRDAYSSSDYQANRGSYEESGGYPKVIQPQENPFNPIRPASQFLPSPMINTNNPNNPRYPEQINERKYESSDERDKRSKERRRF